MVISDDEKTKNTRKITYSENTGKKTHEKYVPKKTREKNLRKLRTQKTREKNPQKNTYLKKHGKIYTGKNPTKIKRGCDVTSGAQNYLL